MVLAWWLLCGQAEAGMHGLVVHLTLPAPTTVPVVVTLTGDAEPYVVEMKDDGASPDVTAGDAMYSGTTLVQVDTVAVELKLGDQVFSGGSVSWESTQSTCDLNLKVEGDKLVAVATVPAAPVPTQPVGGATTPLTPEGVPPSTPLQPVEGATKPDGVLSINSPAANTPVSPPMAAPSTDTSGMVSIVAGLAVLLAAGLLYLSWSGGGSRMAALPEPGLLGPNTPSLSEGLSRWDASPEDTPLLAKILLATLVRHHRVLLIATPEFQVDPLFGGPVYRVAARPAAWEKAIQGLMDEGGLPLTVLYLGGAQPEALKKVLPEGVGGIILGGDAEKMPVVKCIRDGERWHLQIGEAMMMIGASARGFDEAV